MHNDRDTFAGQTNTQPPLLSRRQLLGGSAAAVGLASVARPTRADEADSPKMRFCLNTSTLREHKLSLVEEVELAAKVGYDGIEPWMRELDRFEAEGGKLDDLGKRIRDLGLTVESAIGFAPWIVDDDKRRAKALEQARSDMQRLKRIGGVRLAAPPAGATNQTDLDLFRAADRYRALLEVGREEGVVPQVEVWGFSKSLSRLGEAVFVAVESGHEDACLLPDVYHIYKGGSDFNGLRLVEGGKIHVFHMNDYPADPPRETIRDADRVYPGDGVAPLEEIFAILRQTGFAGALSLELFNPEYWKQDPELVARTGLAKMKAAAGK